MLDDEMCNWTWLHTVMSNITVFNIPIYLRHRISFSLQNQKQRIKRAKLNNILKAYFSKQKNQTIWCYEEQINKSNEK